MWWTGMRSLIDSRRHARKGRYGVPLEPLGGRDTAVEQAFRPAEHRGPWISRLSCRPEDDVIGGDRESWVVDGWLAG